MTTYNRLQSNMLTVRRKAKTTWRRGDEHMATNTSCHFPVANVYRTIRKTCALAVRTWVGAAGSVSAVIVNA